MSKVFSFYAGDSPLLVSVPHDGRALPPDVEASMTPAALALPDTDWYVARLYAFCRDLGANMLVAGYSRYVVDLNRPADDASLYPGQATTGLCPTQTFDGESIYVDDAAVSDEERERRVDRYWVPYHEQLASCLREQKERFGYALLWDAHSISSYLPRLFDGTLPALNIGTNGGSSCPGDVQRAVTSVADASPYSAVVNGRFLGGYITRHYGHPADGCYAIQLELAQRCYMDEDTLVYDQSLAASVTETLRQMLTTFVAESRARGRPDGQKDRHP